VLALTTCRDLLHPCRGATLLVSVTGGGAPGGACPPATARLRRALRPSRALSVVMDRGIAAGTDKSVCATLAARRSKTSGQHRECHIGRVRKQDIRPIPRVNVAQTLLSVPARLRRARPTRIAGWDCRARLRARCPAPTRTETVYGDDKTRVPTTTGSVVPVPDLFRFESSPSFPRRRLP
jgi:hypothetical protein